MARKAAADCLSEGRKLWMDLVVIDVVREKAWIVGYDGEITMTIPDSAFWHILDKVETGDFSKGG